MRLSHLERSCIQLGASMHTLRSLLRAQEKFTRFATIACAITGQPFVPAAKAVFDTLKRNFLQTYSLWWVGGGQGGGRRGYMPDERPWRAYRLCPCGQSSVISQPNRGLGPRKLQQPPRPHFHAACARLCILATEAPALPVEAACGMGMQL